ncbi:membrane protein [Streptomyces sp. NRRL WC-3753]|nr:membrane protein [Streptomyces sp. NRRL WC-3753]
MEKAPGAGPRDEPARRADAEGCLAVAVRIPVRIVVLVLVVPVRMAWDALVVVGRFLRDTVLRPVGRALGWLGRAFFVWPLVALWRYGVVPLAKGVGWLGNVLLVVPAVWLYRWVLTPAGHVLARFLTAVGAVFAAIGRGLYAGLAWLARYLLVVPGAWLYRWVLAPVGHALAWCGRGLVWCCGQVARGVGLVVTGVGFVLYWTVRVLLVLPALAVWRWVLVPVGRALAVVGREVADAVGHAWRIAGHVSRAVGRFLGTLLRWTVVEPVRWVYRSVLTPVGHAVRDAVLRPLAEAGRGAGRAVRQALASARLSVRRARADVRRMLFGEPAERQPADRREPSAAEARTLGSSTTALTKD